MTPALNLGPAADGVREPVETIADRKIKVGDTLWYAKNQPRGDRSSKDFSGPSKVLKIGRAWITTEHGRFAIGTFKSEHERHGKLYAREAEQTAERALDKAWDEFRYRIASVSAWKPPLGLTMETLRQIETMLWPITPETSP